ncbi:hypothetical protein I1A25_02225 [Staphylococcus epidermidis]|jgi:hypothetical protein|uniref:hypothetical protein n=1 Tax=Staphylococcus TaxID=1279 RepID=UPI00069CF411|nr:MULTISPECIES: hypothetical protein [Staphylococcus]MBC3013629.1 hypothetical protein [Staphylococcus haemolyticus]MBC3114871.1 hypothetical protein [Staphylococcus haemolyticus]MBC3124016.1 hypothetical protein [Staphylococcus haemolyticus]MBF8037126.1 hypothetical protein [Staphylococcus epidermidis]MBF8059113.1 hypothetical protein [Staphylococcus epidermidis]
MKQSVNLQLFNFLYTKFSELGVPIIRTSELNQELSYPFIAIQNIRDEISRLTFDSYSGTPTATIHIWCLDDDKGKNDELYIRVQSILLDEIELDGYTLTLPQISVNESTEQDTNQVLSHTTINVEYASH